jgi:hypothetical protein
MRWPRIIFLSLVILLIAAFLHYTLPQRDVVRIVNVESRLTEVSGLNGWFYAQRDSGTAQSTGMRDIRLISTIRPDGRPLVFRNEDTGVLWPPYFKIDSQDVQAEAQDLRSTRDIAAMGGRHALWLAVEPVVDPTPMRSGPSRRWSRRELFPWLNIVILLGMVLVLFMAWRIWERFEDRVIDPSWTGPCAGPR